MTCILVCFPGAPTPCEAAIRKERALDAALGRRVAGGQAVDAQREGGWQAGAPYNIYLLLRAVLLCPGAPQPERGFQGSGFRGHPRFTSWGRALLQVSQGGRGRMGRGLAVGGPPPEGLLLLSRAAVIAEAYSQLHQASGKRWEVRILCS